MKHTTVEITTITIVAVVNAESLLDEELLLKASDQVGFFNCSGLLLSTETIELININVFQN